MSMEKMKGKFTSPEPDFSKMRSYWVQFPMLVNQVSIWSSNKKTKQHKVMTAPQKYSTKTEIVEKSILVYSLWCWENAK